MSRNFLSISLVVIGSFSLFMSCSSAYYVQPSGIPVDEAYYKKRDAAHVSILDAKSPLYRQKTVPVLYPPKVFGCYVPNYIDSKRDIVIGEHWVFFKLSESSWFLENEIDGIEFETKDVRSPDKLIEIKYFFADNMGRSIIPVRAD